MTFHGSRLGIRFGTAAAAIALLHAAAFARVDVTLDAESLNGLLSAMAPNKVSVPLAQGRAVTLLLEDLRVTGFDPSEGDKQQGFILTTLRVRIPELGVDVPLEPRLSLQVREKDGNKIAFLRFEKVPVPLPLTGPVDVAPLLRSMPLPTDTAWMVTSAAGNVRVRSRLLDARLGAKAMRLGFNLETSPAP